jgi:hypothetical protein
MTQARGRRRIPFGEAQTAGEGLITRRMEADLRAWDVENNWTADAVRTNPSLNRDREEVQRTLQVEAETMREQLLQAYDRSPGGGRGSRGGRDAQQTATEIARLVSEALRRRVEAVSEQLDQARTPAEVDALQADFDAAWQEYAQARQEQLNAELADETNQQIIQLQNEALDAELAIELQNATEEFRDRLIDVLTTQFDEMVQVLERGTAEAERRMEDRMRASQNRLEIMQGPGGRGRYSQTELRMAQDGVDQAEREALPDRIASQRISVLQAEVMSEAAADALRRAQNEEERQRLQVQADEAVERLRRERLSLEGMETRQAALAPPPMTREDNDRVGKWNFLGDLSGPAARAGAIVAESFLTPLGNAFRNASRSLGEKLFSPEFRSTVRASVDQWAQDSGILVSTAGQVADGMKTVFDNLKSSLAETITSVANGTATIGDAFKALGRSIADSFLNLAVEMLTNQLILWVLEFVLGGTPGVKISKTPSPLRRASGGPIPGVDLGRDSVPVLARPGEYVLQRSAADMIGRENLDFMNRTGQLAASNLMTVSGQSKREPDTVNVYAVMPNQVPPTSEKDIVIAVQRDIVEGGKTRALIKQVAIGA